MPNSRKMDAAAREYLASDRQFLACVEKENGGPPKNMPADRSMDAVLAAHGLTSNGNALENLNVPKVPNGQVELVDAWPISDHSDQTDAGLSSSVHWANSGIELNANA